MGKKIEFTESNTLVFAGSWPWVVFTSAIVSDTLHWIDILEADQRIVFAIALIPVVVSVIWFHIKQNK